MPHTTDESYPEGSYDAARYDTAIGWQPPRPRQRPFTAIAPGPAAENPFEISRGGPLPSAPLQLCGPLWQEGEVAVLFGPPGSGKSVLAVQIAEGIARGRPLAPFAEGKRAASRGLRVLYVDFERTPAQFSQRYSVPHPLPGKLPVRYRFSTRFIRASLSPDFSVPEEYRAQPHRYITDWLQEMIEQTAARVLIIDNISYLAHSIATPRSAAPVMKNLRLWANRRNISILAVVHAKPASYTSRRLADGTAATLAGLPAAPIADLADSVFAIAPSRLGPDIRYIKPLKSRNTTLEHNAQNVITCQLTRDHPQHQKRTSSSSALIPQSALHTPHSPSPFLGLTFLDLTPGDCGFRNTGKSFLPESIHLTDPSAEPPRRTEKRITPTPHPALPKPRSQMTTLEMLLSREYWRYLER